MNKFIIELRLEITTPLCHFRIGSILKSLIIRKHLLNVTKKLTFIFLKKLKISLLVILIYYKNIL